MFIGNDVVCQNKSKSRVFLLQTVVLITFLAGCATSQKPVNEPATPPEQPFGEYLAGQHAQANMDIGAAAEYHQKALELDPDNLSLLGRTFSLCIADGRYDCAVRAANRLRQNGRADSLVHLFLFLEKVEAGANEKALGLLEQVGDAGVYGLFKPLLRAWIAAEQGRREDVELYLNQLFDNDSFENFKKYHAGLIYEYIGEYETAERLYAEALVNVGGITLRNIEAYGRLLQKLGREADARQLYVNYLEKAPDNETLEAGLKRLKQGLAPGREIRNYRDGLAEIFYTSASFLMQDNIRTPATLYLRLAKYLKPDFYHADFLLGQIFEIDDYYEGALNCLANIPPESPFHYRARLQQAWILEKTGRIEEAVAAMKALIAEYPEKIETYGALGDLYRIHSRFAEAGEAYTKLIERLDKPEQKHWTIFYTRGIVLERQQRWHEAEKDFFRALELQPDQPQVLNYLAYSWVERGENLEQARRMLEKAAELRPHDGYIIDSLGWALFKMGYKEKALEILEKAVLLQSDDWAINDHLGDVYWAVGRKNEARFQWRHALSLNPDADKIPVIRRKLKHGYTPE
ncbi:tetratricopeptide repeat protein [Luteithermobacter gelatinilyticus]|uniref:tetratricopeptide repeat protein n=1 Tax=Luteithermobacter gelatinilyticus TaxID=2582913 RepID=UPI001105CC53|nr:tetratricopeptide repeat protein [Luteithermobacter gelatinilyticus]